MARCVPGRFYMLTAKQTFKLRQKIIDKLFHYPGVTLVGDTIDHMSEDIASVMKGVAVSVVADSVRSLVGSVLTDESIKALAWRLAGNTDRLYNNVSVPVWCINPEPEWVIIQVSQVYPINRLIRAGDKKTDARYYHLDLMVMTGGPSGLKTSVEWSSRLCSVRAMTTFGFSRPNGKYPFTSALDFTNMQCLGLITADACIDNKPGFEEFKSSSTTIAWNRSFLKKRARIDFICQESYTIPCSRCWHGYESCEAACRPKDLAYNTCASCGNDYWSDGDDGTDGRCQKCAQR